MYGDHTAISHSSRCLSKLQGDLNQDPLNLQNYLDGNKLSLNVVKTVLEKSSLVNMRTETRYLEVQTDDKLQGDGHIEQVKAEALLALCLIKHTTKFLSSGDLHKMS